MSSIRVFFACIILVFAGLPLSVGAENIPTDKLKILTSGGPVEFTVEVPKTEQDQERGLMFRTSMPADHGMLFYWKKPWVVKMWMKNTKIPLDMLFIDAQGEIVYIAAHTEPDTTDPIGPNRMLNAVLELPGDTAAAQHIHIGDRVIHAYFHNTH